VRAWRARQLHASPPATFRAASHRPVVALGSPTPTALLLAAFPARWARPARAMCASPRGHAACPTGPVPGRSRPRSVLRSGAITKATIRPVLRSTVLIPSVRPASPMASASSLRKRMLRQRERVGRGSGPPARIPMGTARRTRANPMAFRETSTGTVPSTVLTSVRCSVPGDRPTLQLTSLATGWSTVRTSASCWATGLADSRTV